MEYKVLIKVYYPILEISFELYIPTTKSVKYITKLLQKAIQETYSKSYTINPNAIICNKHSGQRYEAEKLIIDTDIRNGSKLIII